MVWQSHEVLRLCQYLIGEVNECNTQIVALRPSLQKAIQQHKARPRGPLHAVVQATLKDRKNQLKNMRTTFLRMMVHSVCTMCGIDPDIEWKDLR